MLLLGVAFVTVSGAGRALETTDAAKEPVCLRGSLAGSLTAPRVGADRSRLLGAARVWGGTFNGSHRRELRAVENGLVFGFGSDVPSCLPCPGFPSGRRGAEDEAVRSFLHLDIGLIWLAHWQGIGSLSCTATHGARAAFLARVVCVSYEPSSN